MNTPATPIAIVRATIEDVPLIAPLFDGYRQFYQQPSNLEGARHFLTERLEEKSSVIFLALRTDEKGEQQPCGFTQLYPSFSSVSMKRLWILNDLFVAPEARRLGVSRALLERARTFAAETQAQGLTLSTAVDNYTAQALYESAGWKRDEEFYAYHLYFSF
jgi:ribosomal protein S18 acetylase RimI-like enzyme